MLHPWACYFKSFIYVDLKTTISLQVDVNVLFNEEEKFFSFFKKTGKKMKTEKVAQ